MFARTFVLLVLVLVLGLAACGGSESPEEEAGPDAAAAPTTAAAAQAAVLVTTDCGREVLVERTPVEAGENAMRALQRVAEVETDDGGKFVTEIEGEEQNTSKKLAWLLYIDGEPAEVGASEITLEAGDVQWWDLHNWEQLECPTVPPEAR